MCVRTGHRLPSGPGGDRGWERSRTRSSETRPRPLRSWPRREEADRRARAALPIGQDLLGPLKPATPRTVPLSASPSHVHLLLRSPSGSKRLFPPSRLHRLLDSTSIHSAFSAIRHDQRHEDEARGAHIGGRQCGHERGGARGSEDGHYQVRSILAC